MLCKPIKLSHDPNLHGATKPINSSRAFIGQRVMKNDRAPGSVAVCNPNYKQCANRKPSMRPSKRSVLKEDPFAVPAFGFTRNPLESADPSVRGPGDAQDFHRMCAMIERVFQPMAIIFQRVSGGIGAAEEG